ncbi:helix-turn-helix domain-containing protein [Ralstonia solanacearum]|uniref:helix-turn-helix domain-containing protein n=1 Tax=Ralstonia solanacearum TaxID=305 RepID=UPI002032971E
MTHQVLLWWTMDFPKRLAALRKERGLTQQALADLVGVHLSQLKRYEGGTSQPTLEVLRVSPLRCRSVRMCCFRYQRARPG